MFINEQFTNEQIRKVSKMFNELDLLLSGHQFKKIFEKKYEGIMKKYDLRKIDIEILNFVSSCGENDTARDIANIQYISKAYISNSIDDLTHKKYLSIIEDCQDRRRFHLRLTETAKPIIDEIEMIRNQIFDVLFQNITEDERQVFIRISQKITQNINEDLNNRI